MKRPLQLSLAIALALSGTDALALGLGTIHVNSRLNQPLDAEIPVLQGTQGEAEGLAVQLAAAEDFDRVGLNRSRLSVPLEFSVVKGNRGDQNYQLPADVDLSRYESVSIWCKRFGVNFGSATLKPR